MKPFSPGYPWRCERVATPSGDRALDAPWLGTGYNTLPEVFRNTARPAIVAAGRDVTMKQGLF